MQYNILLGTIFTNIILLLSIFRFQFYILVLFKHIELCRYVNLLWIMWRCWLFYERWWHLLVNICYFEVFYHFYYSNFLLQSSVRLNVYNLLNVQHYKISNCLKLRNHIMSHSWSSFYQVKTSAELSIGGSWRHKFTCICCVILELWIRLFPYFVSRTIVVVILLTKSTY